MANLNAIEYPQLAIQEIEGFLRDPVSFAPPFNALARDVNTLRSALQEANGNIVGDQDFAQLAVGGVVKLAPMVADATVSTVSVTAPTITTPASYSVSWATEVQTITSELKTDVNQLVTDLNAAITQLNAVIAAMKTAMQMEP